MVQVLLVSIGKHLWLLMARWLHQVPAIRFGIMVLGRKDTNAGNLIVLSLCVRPVWFPQFFLSVLSGSFWLGRIRKLHDPICNPLAQGKPVVEPSDNTFVFSFMDDFYHQRRLTCDRDPSDGIISKGTVIQVLNMTSRNLLSMTSENDECCHVSNIMKPVLSVYILAQCKHGAGRASSPLAVVPSSVLLRCRALALLRPSLRARARLGLPACWQPSRTTRSRRSPTCGGPRSLALTLRFCD